MVVSWHLFYPWCQTGLVVDPLSGLDFFAAGPQTASDRLIARVEIVSGTSAPTVILSTASPEAVVTSLLSGVTSSWTF